MPERTIKRRLESGYWGRDSVSRVFGNMSMSDNLNWRALDRFSFGDGPALADELADLVLAGRKLATCWPSAMDPSRVWESAW
jgi:hypothetical protein